MKISRLLMCLIYMMISLVGIAVTVILDIFKEDMLAWPTYVILGLIFIVGLIGSIYIAVSIDTDTEQDEEDAE